MRSSARHRIRCVGVAIGGSSGSSARCARASLPRRRRSAARASPAARYASRAAQRFARLVAEQLHPIVALVAGLGLGEREQNRLLLALAARSELTVDRSLRALGGEVAGATG